MSGHWLKNPSLPTLAICIAISCSCWQYSSEPQKNPSLLFSQSVHPACILNNMPICAAPPFTCSHTASKRESQSVSRISEPWRAAARASGNLHQSNLNHISKTDCWEKTQSLNSSSSCLEISFPLVIFKRPPSQTTRSPPRAETSV